MFHLFQLMSRRKSMRIILMMILMIMLPWAAMMTKMVIRVCLQIKTFLLSKEPPKIRTQRETSMGNEFICFKSWVLSVYDLGIQGLMFWSNFFSWYTNHRLVHADWFQPGPIPTIRYGKIELKKKCLGPASSCIPSC